MKDVRTYIESVVHIIANNTEFLILKETYLNQTTGVRHNIWGNEIFDRVLHSPSAFLVLL